LFASASKSEWGLEPLSSRNSTNTDTYPNPIFHLNCKRSNTLKDITQLPNQRHLSAYSNNKTPC
jgi:hypothetical protein